jgi:uncharacterized protein
MMARSKPCPLAAHAPFCSQGCRDRDLLQWLGEGYALPVSTPPGEEQDGLDSTPERD